MTEILKIINLSKSFPGVKALENVNFHVREGEIHGLMGENGAGKSTLIKVITGFYKRDKGDIVYNNKSINFDSPQEASENGISTVYQEINLIPLLSVAENIYIGRQPLDKFGGIKWDELYKQARETIKKLDLNIDVTQPLESYPVAIQQMVSIARALDIEAKILILDEPTSSLDATEARQLFTVLRKLRLQGISIIFITHFIDQVFDITDRITVLRNGRLVGVFDTKSLTRMDLIANMLGKNTQEFETDFKKEHEISTEKELLSVTGMYKLGMMNTFNLKINRGEVLGLAGLLGSGRTEIAKLLYGVEKADGGKISVNNIKVNIRNPIQAISMGFGFCPEDRKALGIIPELSVRENIMLALQAKQGIFRNISKKKQEEIVKTFIKSLNIKTPNMEQSVKNLSGGNQQRVILARWLAANPQLLILDEPTRGIDIGAKIEILKLILHLKNKGISILLISSELDEVVRCSSRIAVLRDRHKVKELTGNEVNEKSILETIASE